MFRLNRTSSITLFLILLPVLSEKSYGDVTPSYPVISPQDTMISSQVLYNGRAWRNLYTSLKGDPYLFTKDFMPGSVTISGKSFDNNMLLYDICKDEVMILSGRNFIMQLNKELMERFTLSWKNNIYRFVKLGGDSTAAVNGFVNELYGGKSAVYVKYVKKMANGVVEDKYDGFVQSFRIFVVKDGIPHLVRNKKQLIDLFKDNKQKITGFIKSSRLDVSGRRPETFVPVAEYYDSLNR
jgi:hypothetical protein